MGWTNLPEGDDRRLHIPPGARGQSFARAFSKVQRQELKGLGVTNDQLVRLEAALRVIAYYSVPAPSLAEVREPLDELIDRARAAASSLESLLRAPEQEAARAEAKGRFLQSVYALHPDRCFPDGQSVDFFARRDGREQEAVRLLGKLREVEEVAAHARKQMPATASRSVAHWYPIAYIHEALRHGWVKSTLSRREPIPASASVTSPFRRIAGICYAAAKAPNHDPERAIRAYLKTLDAGTKNSTKKRPSSSK